MFFSIIGCSATGSDSTRKNYPSAPELREFGDEKKEAADSEEPLSEESTDSEEPLSDEATDSEEPLSDEAADSEGNSNLSNFDDHSKLDRKNTDLDPLVGTVIILEQQYSSQSSAEIDIEHNVSREEPLKPEETFYIYIPED